MNTLERALECVTAHEALDMVQMIVIEAHYFWKSAEREYDFCIQYLSSNYIVFGGVNRVVWSIRKGFQIERSYCTQHFQDAYDRSMG